MLVTWNFKGFNFAKFSFYATEDFSTIEVFSIIIIIIIIFNIIMNIYFPCGCIGVIRVVLHVFHPSFNVSDKR